MPTVKYFYSNILGKNGWVESSDEEVGVRGKQETFRKGEFSIVVFYTGNHSGPSYNYAIDFIWRSR